MSLSVSPDLRPPDSSHADVCVIVAAYNCASTIEACLASLQAQTMTSWQCIVVDDGSADATASLVNHLAKDDPRITYIAQANAGPSVARNRGLSVTSSAVPFVFFLDSDDLLEPTALEILATHLSQDPQVTAVGCQYSALDLAGNKVPARRSRYVPALPVPRDLTDDEVVTPFVSFLCVTGNGPFYLYRQSVLRDIGGYDEKLWSHEDADLLCRCALAGAVHYLPDRLYVKRSVAESLTFRGSRMGGGHVFHDKWHGLGQNAIDISIPTVRNALRYESFVHVPLRDIKVVVKNVKQIRLTNPGHHLRTVIRLTVSAVRGFTGMNWRSMLAAAAREGAQR